MLKLPLGFKPFVPNKGASDLALLASVRQGNAPAAKKLVQLLSPRAHALAWRMLGDAALAQDVVQEAFIKLLATDSFQGEASVSTYFHTIVSRACLDRLRVARGTSVSLEDDMQLLETSDEGASDPQRSRMQSEQARQVQQALMSLKPRQRVALSLWAYQDATASDIANIMGLEINAVHQLLHRAKINLRHLLGEPNDH